MHAVGQMCISHCPSSVSYDSARAGGGALPVIMSIIRSSAKSTTTATITFECAVQSLQKKSQKKRLLPDMVCPIARCMPVRAAKIPRQVAQGPCFKVPVRARQRRAQRHPHENRLPSALSTAGNGKGEAVSAARQCCGGGSPIPAVHSIAGMILLLSPLDLLCLLPSAKIRFYIYIW